MKPFKHHFKSILLSLFVIPLLALTACGANGDNNGNAGSGESSENNEGDSSYSGTVVFADEQFLENKIHNEIAGIILEEGYGLETDVKTASAASTMLGLEKGDIHIFMSLWTLSLQDVYQKAKDSGKVTEATVIYDDNTQGFYVPKYMIEGDPDRDIEPITPDLKRLEQLPEYWEVFKDPADSSKGRIIGAPTAYEAHNTLQTKMESYNLNETYNYQTPGSDTALTASLKKAYDAGDPWVGYAWTPTWFAEEFDLVLLEEPEFTQECWDADRDCAFPSDDVAIAVNTEFAEEAPEIMDFLSQYSTDANTVSEMLLRNEKEDESPEETAIWWLKKDDSWKEWIPDDVAKKVEESL